MNSSAVSDPSNASSSSSDNWDDYCLVQHLIYHTYIEVLFCILYALIFACGIAGNVVVCVAVVRGKQLHNVTNFFIMNLAISDILMCTFSVPFTPLQSFSGRWDFGEVLCKLFPFSQGFSVYVSTLTLTIIAIDRYVVIIYPFRARMQLKTCFALIFIINVAAFVFTAPYAYHVELARVSDSEDSDLRCSESWTGLIRTAYGAFTNMAQFVLPFVTIIFCYVAVMRKLGKRPQRPGMRSAEREELERARSQRTNRMLISMVVVFGTCWLPLQTINFIADLNLVDIFCWEYHHFTFFVCHVIAMSSTCYNPLLYAWHNETFRKEISRLTSFKKSIQRNEATAGEAASVNRGSVIHAAAGAGAAPAAAPAAPNSNVGRLRPRGPTSSLRRKPPSPSPVATMEGEKETEHSLVAPRNNSTVIFRESNSKPQEVIVLNHVGSADSGKEPDDDDGDRDAEAAV